MYIQYIVSIVYVLYIDYIVCMVDSVVVHRVHRVYGVWVGSVPYTDHSPVETNTSDMRKAFLIFLVQGIESGVCVTWLLRCPDQCWNPQVWNASISVCGLSIYGGLATLEQWPTCLPAGSNIVHPHLCRWQCLDLLMKSSCIWTGGLCASNRCLPQKSDDWKPKAAMSKCKTRCPAFWRSSQRSESFDGSMDLCCEWKGCFGICDRNNTIIEQSDKIIRYILQYCR